MYRGDRPTSANTVCSSSSSSGGMLHIRYTYKEVLVEGGGRYSACCTNGLAMGSRPS